MMSELASPSYIEVKWTPPYSNGAEILMYEVKMSTDEHLPDAKWTLINPDVLKAGTRNYGYDGRRVTEREKDTKLFRTDEDGSVLEPNIRYFFKVRAANSVGWGAWSSATGFLTRPVKPAKCDDIRHVESGSNHVRIEWDEPQCHGKPVLRYDLFASPISPNIRWLHMSTMLLGLTIDTDRLAGPNVELPEQVEMDREHGKECFDQLLCPYTMYIPISGNRTFYDLGGLLPGSNYYFTV